MPATPVLAVSLSDPESGSETENASSEPNLPRTRATLTVRAGAVIRGDVVPEAAHRGDRPNRFAAPSSENGVVPLKRLTGGRKDLKIGHDGATYLLRITKSNKLILTKADD